MPKTQEENSGAKRRHSLLGFSAQSTAVIKLSQEKAAPSAAFSCVLMMATSGENKEILSYINVLSIASMILSEFF
ncbi:MAG: hypothetical protein ACK59J_18740 [Pseudanabaena sp.]